MDSDDIFVEKCIADINRYAFNCDAQTVLLFPSVDGKHRFLIHKAVDVYPQFLSFSVGGEENRQTAVAHTTTLLAHVAATATSTAACGTPVSAVDMITHMNVLDKCKEDPGSKRAKNALFEPETPVADSSQGDANGSRQLKAFVAAELAKGTSKENVTEKDKEKSKKVKTGAQVYVPRARREAMEAMGNNSATEDASATAESNTTILSFNADGGSDGEGEIGSGAETSAANAATAELRLLLKEINKSNHFADEESSHKPNIVTGEAIPDVSVLNQTEVLEDRIRKEILAAIGHVKVTRPELNMNAFYAFRPKPPKLDYAALHHCAEVSEFPASMTEEDIRDELCHFTSTEYRLLWVDDTHVVAIFSNTELSKQATLLNCPKLRIVPLSESTLQTKLKVHKLIEEVSKPHKPRPQTSSLVAHRLVASALGVRADRSHVAQEREKLDQARQRLRDEEQTRESTPPVTSATVPQASGSSRSTTRGSLKQESNNKMSLADRIAQRSRFGEVEDVLDEEYVEAAKQHNKSVDDGDVMELIRLEEEVRGYQPADYEDLLTSHISHSPGEHCRVRSKTAYRAMTFPSSNEIIESSAIEVNRTSSITRADSPSPAPVPDEQDVAAPPAEEQTNYLQQLCDESSPLKAMNELHTKTQSTVDIAVTLSAEDTELTTRCASEPSLNCTRVIIGDIVTTFTLESCDGPVVPVRPEVEYVNQLLDDSD